MEGDVSQAQYDALQRISIHALRVEGDIKIKIKYFSKTFISIHALRVEGDNAEEIAQSVRDISIHALRVEGDSMSPSTTGIVPGFLSTPSGWRATAQPTAHRPRRC